MLFSMAVFIGFCAIEVEYLWMWVYSPCLHGRYRCPRTVNQVRKRHGMAGLDIAAVEDKDKNNYTCIYPTVHIYTSPSN